MSEFKDRLHLTEMLEAISEIEMDIAGLDQETWTDTSQAVRSVSMSLITLGEGAVQLSETLKAEAPAVPWARMIGMRNRLAHAYFRADRQIIWEAAKLHAPAIKLELRRLLSLVEGRA